MKELLTTLAEKYETADFLPTDPSQFMHRYTIPKIQERVAFIAAALSYGSRKQFLPKIEGLLNEIDSHPGRPFFESVPNDDGTFYRLHTNAMVRRFLHVLYDIEEDYGSLRGMLAASRISNAPDALKLFTAHFASRGASDLIPKNTQSSCKRLCMFLRWMVRDSSPVDIGLWSRMMDKTTLIIPLDTHVLQEAMKLGLINSRCGAMATAVKLTERLKEIFPDDPLKGDFALFGVGVDELKNKN